MGKTARNQAGGVWRCAIAIGAGAASRPAAEAVEAVTTIGVGSGGGGGGGAGAFTTPLCPPPGMAAGALGAAEGGGVGNGVGGDVGGALGVAAGEAVAELGAGVGVGSAVGTGLHRGGTGERRCRRRRGADRRRGGHCGAGVVGGEDLRGTAAGEPAGLRSPLVELPTVRVRAARLASGARVVVGGEDVPVPGDERRPGRVDRRGHPGINRARRIVDLVARAVEDIEACAAARHEPAVVEDLVPGVRPDGQRTGAQRLGRPAADPLPGQDVLQVGAKLHRLDRPARHPIDADRRRRLALARPGGA